MKKKICEVLNEKFNINGEENVIKEIAHEYEDWQNDLSDYKIQRGNKRISDKSLYKGICNRFTICENCCRCGGW